MHTPGCAAERRRIPGAISSGLALAALAITLIVTATTTARAPGTTITVDTRQDQVDNSDGDCSLREAVLAANLDTPVDGCPAGDGHDTILLGVGTYSLTVGAGGEDLNAGGDLDILDDLTLIGAGASSTVIDGTQSDRVLHIHNGAAVHVDALLVTHGRTGEAISGCNGGGIRNDGTLTLTHSTVVSNSTCPGGGAVQGPSGGDGGGIYSTDRLVVADSIVSANVTGSSGPAGHGGHGGGIYGSGVVVVSSSIITGNTTGYGGHCGLGGNGGGICNDGTLTVTNSTIGGNSTGHEGHWAVGPPCIMDAGYGGGLFNGGTMRLTESTVSANVTGWGWQSPGGGICNLGKLALTNSTISGNRAGLDIAGEHGAPGDIAGIGGGIYNDGSLTASHSTIAHNSGGSPGGVANGPMTAAFRNTIVAGNAATKSAQSDCSGSLASHDYNLLGDNTGCTFTPQAHDQVGTGSNPIDPALGPLADNGGPPTGFGGAPWTHALQYGSPALNAGSCVHIDGNPLAADQRGVPRPQGLACDVGAFEARRSLIYLPLLLRDGQPGG
jgi:CSLREA domain-containing protein